MDEKAIHLQDYISVIHKRRFLVYTVAVVVMVAVLIATFTSTPVYMASTKLYIEKVEPYSFIKERFYTSYDPEFYGTQYQLIKSRRVAMSVVRMLAPGSAFRAYFKLDSSDDSVGLSPLRWFSRLFALVLRITGKKEEPPPAEAEEGSWERMIARNIAEAIRVKPVRDSKIVDISYMSENPELARLVANTVAMAYIEALFDMKMSASKHTLQWMTKKVEEERAKLEKSEVALQQYMQANDIITLENRLTIVPEKLSELSTKLTKAETRRQELETLYGRVKALPPDLGGAESLPTISTDSTLRSIREQIMGAEKNLIELSKKFGRKHPLMIRGVGDLDVLREKRQQEIGRVIESIKNEYELALSNERNLKRFLGVTKQEALNLSEKFIQYGVLKREVETNSQLYDSLITKMKEQSITEEIQSVNVWIVEEAETPRHPAKPKKLLNILLGIIVAFSGGLGIAFFVEYLDHTVKSPEDAEARLGVPVLGAVSLLKGGLKGEGLKNIEKIVIEEPKSTYAESYKALRTAIMLSSADSPPRSLLVTSSGPGEGKTTTSVNLALAVAQAGLKVLLMDGDLRKPTIHKIFEKPNRVGLSTYLTGDTSEIVLSGPLPGMDIITSGPIPPNPSELLGARNFGKLMADLGSRYDMIICDSSPTLTVTDSIILSRQFDGTIVVVRAGKTGYEFVRRGLKLLTGRRSEDAKSTVLGVLINAIDLTKSDYYYKYYHYYYAYGEDRSPEDKGRGEGPGAVL